METVSAIASLHHTCAHCGLPVTNASAKPGDGPVYCCHACRMVSAVVGRRGDGERAWVLLRLGLGALFSMNVMMISLLLYTGGVQPETAATLRLVMLGLATPSLLLLLPPFLMGALRERKASKLSLDTLIAAGSLFAYVISATNAVTGSGEVYFDTATMLPVLVTVGKLLEASAKTRAAELLHSLEALLPATALRMNQGEAEEVGLQMLRQGDLIRIRPGERVAVDGTVIEGASSIEEASFSGEFLPRHCRCGDKVIAGTVNGTGTLLVRADKTGEELLLNGIVELIQQAWTKPSRSERIAERAATLFIPAVLVISTASLLYWSFLSDPARGILSALSVLVVACPCTMGIATPLATSLAVARAAKSGIAVRGGEVMEGIARTETVFFDKTGTLTAGTPVLGELLPASGVSEEELLGRLAALEAASEHALGKAVVAKAKELRIEPGQASAVEVVPGRGICGKVTWRGETKIVTAGNGSFVGGEKRSPPAKGDHTLVEVAWDGGTKGRLLFTDEIRPGAADCVRSLRRQGIDCIMLSGDTFQAAAAVAEKVGIESFHAPCPPEGKFIAVSNALQFSHGIAMVGDGINDAPALAAADTGIALGGGMDLAKQAGNVVILSGDLCHIPWLIHLSKRTTSIVRGNFAWSFGYNAIASAAAAAGLLHPLIAALAMIFSSVTVLGNSLRITAFPDPPRGE